ncbi:hypothetical protein [Halomonas sp. H5]|uniref:hypothetical protein n=1 Tax=Halomonas sp. H5 TaxID=3423910 RepID=UPI003D35FAAC
MKTPNFSISSIRSRGLSILRGIIVFLVAMLLALSTISQLSATAEPQGVRQATEMPRPVIAHFSIADVFGY